MVKVTCQIETYNDQATPSVKIHNHFCNPALVELEVEGKRYVIKGNEMKEAINNCMNTARI